MAFKRTFWVASVVAAAMLAGACGKDGGGSGSGGAGGAGASGPTTGSQTGGATPGTGGSTPGNFTCCINDAHYRCPDKQAFDKCVGFDLGGCLAACAPTDPACMQSCFQQASMATPDPSSCSEDPSVDCGSGTGGGGPGLCVGDWDGTQCDHDFDCDSGNCFQHHCYATDPGNPCNEDFNCASENCYQNCCYGNAHGDKCDEDFNCDSENCFNHVCQ